MTTKEAIQANEKQLHKLECINLLEKLIKVEQENIRSFYKFYPSLQQKAKNRIQKKEVAIFKLKTKYNSNLKNIKL